MTELRVRIAEEVRVPLGGPWFEDLKVGQVVDDAPPLTLTTAHALLHQSLTGDRLRLPLDHSLSAAVTGREAPLAHPLLVANVAIGQTTGLTQRVKANLFYRGLVLECPVHLGDTLETVTEVAGLRQNQLREGRPATGLAALRCTTRNQDGRQVLDFYRCPMLPLRDPEGDTGLSDDFSRIPEDLDDDRLKTAVADWDLSAFRARTATGLRIGDLMPGTVYALEFRDTVTGATELARATLNLAEAHTDARRSPYGRRLVYGGHTISLAGAAVSRALPGLVTIPGWRSCDHAGPVFEGDALRTEVEVEAVTPLESGGGLVDLRARVWVDRPAEEAPPGAPAGEQLVLDWRLVGLVA
ncbi:MAG: MaoC family dehydratase [Acidimicrobiia bacterium]